MEISGFWHPDDAVKAVSICERLKAEGKPPVFRLDYHGRPEGKIQFILTLADSEPKTVFLSGSMRASGRGGS